MFSKKKKKKEFEFFEPLILLWKNIIFGDIA